MRHGPAIVLAIVAGATTFTAAAPAAEPATAASAPYTVKDASTVDANTYAGWKTWRALACDRCHGNEGQGLVGPSLLDSLQRLSKDEFHAVMMSGRPEKGMPGFSSDALVQKSWEGLYAYLKGRSDGKIAPGSLRAIDAATK
jgi:mono/diheme cytochrome c family protein